MHSAACDDAYVSAYVHETHEDTESPLAAQNGSSRAELVTLIF